MSCQPSCPRRFGMRRVIGSAALATFAVLCLAADEPVKKAATAPDGPATRTSTATSSTTPKIDFAKEVFPLLRQRCFRCHGPEQQMGEYRLDTKQVALSGGLSAPNIIPGKPADSPLFQRVSAVGKLNGLAMVGEKLDPSELAFMRSRIEQGAEWPDEVGVKATKIDKHWAYLKPLRPDPPAVNDSGLIRNPIDNFVVARLTKE